MISQCPCCLVEMDPARAPVARILQGRVFSFCSSACADKGPGEDPETGTNEPEEVALGDSESERPGGTTGETKQEKTANQQEPPQGGRALASDVHEVAIASSSSSSSSSSPGNWIGVAVACTVLVAGGVLAAIHLLSSGEPEDVAHPQIESTVTSSVDIVPAAEEEAFDPPSSVPSQLFREATEVLRELMESPSIRVQGVAASALARSGDEDALNRLSSLLTNQANLLDRVALAYILAREGREQGRKVLIDSLTHKRRDVRLDAARSLVHLGDRRGGPTLRRMLHLRNYRIGVAGLLAELGYEDAKLILEQIVSSSKESKEHQLRAAVALGRAGVSSVRERLIQILEDGQFRVGAAGALAILGDAAAIPALEAQLLVPGLRVKATLALRRLGHRVALERLRHAMTQGPAIHRATAAESLLILTGSDRLAARD